MMGLLVEDKWAWWRDDTFRSRASDPDTGIGGAVIGPSVV